MKYCAEAQSDVMRSALLTREARITAEGNITHEVRITFCESGTHRCKKHLIAQVLFAVICVQLCYENRKQSKYRKIRKYEI